MGITYIKPKNAVIIKTARPCYVSVTKGSETMFVTFDKIEVGHGYFKFLQVQNLKINLTKPYNEQKNNDLLYIAVYPYITEAERKVIIDFLNLKPSKFSKL
jgi:hypothetical protein